MANFCGKCGAATTPDTQFCGKCGAPTGAAAVNTPAAAPSNPQAGQQSGYAPVPTPQAYSQPIPPQPQSSSALKIVLIIVGIVAALGVAIVLILMFTVWRVSRAVHIEGQGDKVTIHTPGGSISTDTSTSYSASDLGTDIYPGAQSGRGSMKMDLPNGSMVTGIYTTSDSKDQVLAFYKSKFGSSSATFDSPESAMLTLKKSDHDQVLVTITARSSDNDGKTQIAIVHTKSSK